MATNWLVNDAKGRVIGCFRTKTAALVLLRCTPGGYIEKAHDGTIARV